MKRDDDENKSPLTTLLPATPERHKEKRLAKQARKRKVDQRPKKRRTDPSTPTKTKQPAKGKNLLPLA
jgi:hypothetical protein